MPQNSKISPAMIKELKLTPEQTTALQEAGLIGANRGS
jgi:hypothetical protein